MGNRKTVSLQQNCINNSTILHGVVLFCISTDNLYNKYNLYNFLSSAAAAASLLFMLYELSVLSVTWS